MKTHKNIKATVPENIISDFFKYGSDLQIKIYYTFLICIGESVWSPQNGKLQKSFQAYRKETEIPAGIREALA